MQLPSLQIGRKRAKTCIIQGGMSICIALAPLVAAVAREGGVGTIGGMGINPDDLRTHLRTARQMSAGIMGVNLMYVGALFDQLLEVCIDEGPDYVAIGAGFARGPFARLQEHHIPAFAIISSAKAARIVSRTPGISGVVVESGEAGGHLGPKDPHISTWDLFPEVHKELRECGFAGPAIAAGGIIDARGVRRALAMGADGVQLGTRFAMSVESSASLAMKEAWLRATGSQVEWWSPTGYASQAIVPHTDERLPRLDGVTVRCRNCLRICSHRDDPSRSHCIRQALINSQQGSVENGLVFSGAGVGEIQDILTVEEIFQRLTC
jgi:NAD(P)H-dependent flavin oxidoreductase YrpB (nitropropane dioxygenase family)